MQGSRQLGNLITLLRKTRMTADSSTDSPRFIYVVCQHGAETAAKKEITDGNPELRLAFSRPGFLTFKLDAGVNWPEKFTLRSTLARTYGWSLGRTTGADAKLLIDEILLETKLNGPQTRSFGPDDFRHLHVWERDGRVPGHKGFEPGPSVLATEIGALFGKQFEQSKRAMSINEIARPDDKVLDIVLVEPDQWWFGYHYATTIPGRWPGGVPLIDTTVETVSRAYFKAAEALAWSGIEIQAGDWCAEIGSSPGGCCQLLLERGANVIGIDPAEMEPELLANKNFIHIRRRGNEVRKRDLTDVKWLFADLNIVPNYTLDTVTEIVSHESVDIKGMILTMKLPDWKLVEEVPAIMNRVRQLGFSVVKTRQLAFNRQEFCLFAVKDKFLLREGKKQAQQQRRAGKS